MSDYQDRFFKEGEQFLFLCGEKDKKILLSRKKKDKIGELARLACISLVFGYRTVFIRILGEAEKYYDEFIKGLDLIQGNFPQLNDWVEEFIQNVENDGAKQLARELWQERKKTLDRSDLHSKHLLENI